MARITHQERAELAGSFLNRAFFSVLKYLYVKY